MIVIIEQVPESRDVSMIHVTGRFVLSNLPTLLMPPDDDNENWDKFSHPAQHHKGIFHFNDSKGEIELLINHYSSVTITVRGAVEDAVIREPNAQDKNHQQAVASFYERAFTLLNHFIQRYRFNTFNYRTHPIKWQVRLAPANTVTPPMPSEFIVETPMKWDIDFDVDVDEDIDLPAKLNFRIRQDSTDQWGSTSYPVSILERTYGEVSALLEGGIVKKPGKPGIDLDQNAYEIAIELLMRAQELVVGEQKQRREERSATVCAALIITAAACEVFVKAFVQAHGSALHRFLIKGKSLSVENMLHKVLADLPPIGKSLKVFSPELMHNIWLLSQARNSAVHRGKPQITLVKSKQEIELIDEETERISIKQTEVICPIEGWMIYSEFDRGMSADVEGPFGSFVWDVLALIEWLRVMAGGQWLKPAVERYWDRQSKLPVKARESEILERTLALRKRGKL